MDTAYRGFLEVGTTFDIFQNSVLLYIQYGVWMSPGYGVLDFVSSWFLVKCRHRYVVSSLMDTTYRMSEHNVAYCLLTEEGEPSTLQEALNNPNASFRKAVMPEEIEALYKNKTWEMMPLR
ncbi:hypothetical protein Tco_0677977 [Tanacetum coccineum]|uniref:Uncharacterized protein n=1 Tax=Tanacetum coccineum TaxID=301880 RepID=A0ABQ4XEM8_9ASTR